MIQAFTKADVVRISHLQPDGWQSIKSFFQFYVEADFCLPLKIEDNNRIVAIGSLILHTKTAWLAHIIVDPAIRRSGYGLALTEELMARAEKSGRDIQLLIATEMGMPLYERLGFRHSCDYRFYHEPARGMVHESSRVRSLEPADIPEVLSLDQRAIGEDRRALLPRFSSPGWVYMDSGRKQVCPHGAQWG